MDPLFHMCSALRTARRGLRLDLENLIVGTGEVGGDAAVVGDAGRFDLSTVGQTNTLSVDDFATTEAVATITRISSGNFRLITRLVDQIKPSSAISNMSAGPPRSGSRTP